MDLLRELLMRGITGRAPERAIQSPLAQRDTLDEDWKTRYLNQIQNDEQRSQMQPAPEHDGRGLTYPDWLANAGGSRSQSQQAVMGETAPPANPTRDKLAEIIKMGMNQYDPNMPMATMSAQLAEAGEGLPDPFLPAIMSLVETHGGRDITRGQNNAFNMLPTRAGTSYPDLQRAILGGMGDGGQMQKGFRGVIRGGLYDDYLESGDLNDFFDTYSPAADNNADLPVQQQRYNDIYEKYFAPYSR